MNEGDQPRNTKGRRGILRNTDCLRKGTLTGMLRNFRFSLRDHAGARYASLHGGVLRNGSSLFLWCWSTENSSRGGLPNEEWCTLPGARSRNVIGGRGHWIAGTGDGGGGEVEGALLCGRTWGEVFIPLDVFEEGIIAAGPGGYAQGSGDLLDEVLFIVVFPEDGLCIEGATAA